MAFLTPTDLFGLTTQEQEQVAKVGDLMITAAASSVAYAPTGTDLWIFDTEQREALIKAFALVGLQASTFSRDQAGRELQAAFPVHEVVTLQNALVRLAAQIDAANTSPVNTVAPAVTGTGTVGQTLTTTNGTWTGSPTITFARQWRRNTTDIGGATGTTYVLQAGDSGQTVTCRVTATNPSGSTAATSNGVAVA